MELLCRLNIRFLHTGSTCMYLGTENYVQYLKSTSGACAKFARCRRKSQIAKDPETSTSTQKRDMAVIGLQRRKKLNGRRRKCY